ncbi:MAG: aminoglycoside phosphotransferase family protein [Alphaproteobacteria bacterium]
MFPSERRVAIRQFLDRTDWNDAEASLLAGDASFRRYYRLRRGAEQAVLMDAPPPKEDVRPFVAIAEMLCRHGLSAPRILAQDTAAGLLLLEDFGDATYTRVLTDGMDETVLYGIALDALIALHRGYDATAALPAYDERRLLDEAALLVDWYLPALRGMPTSPELRAEYLALWQAVLPVARGVANTLVLRDFHVDNLMLLSDRDGARACGLLDFQDAVIGPLTYDLVSLFEDARRDVPGPLARILLDRYLAAFPDIDRNAFAASYAVMGAQRSAKILGIFTRLDRRDGKPHYLHHIPRVWRWLEGDLKHTALAPLARWFDREIAAECRVAPPPLSPPLSPRGTDR